jgi:hypothetical protein
VVWDLGSAHGTFVQGNRISKVQSSRASMHMLNLKNLWCCFTFRVVLCLHNAVALHVCCLSALKLSTCEWVRLCCTALPCSACCCRASSVHWLPVM